jgi:hypothetical protein
VQLHDLSAVLAAPGPFVTVHVGAESAVEQAASRYDLAWKNVLKRLEDEGVDETLQDAVSKARGEHADGPARLLVASVPEGRVLLSEPVSARPPRDVVQLGRLPDLLPLVAELSARVPHVVVHADRTGADVSANYDIEKVANEITVKGRTLHLRKVPSGGWAHLHYQHRAENQWRENADEIRETVQALAQQVDAELVVGVGDERELTYVKEGLSQPWDTRWVELPGGRGGDGSEDLVEQRVRDRVALHAASSTLELLGQYAQERGQDKRACDGVDAVVEALRKAQVQTLLVTTAADASAELWFGEDPTQLGTSRGEVDALGATAPESGPLLAVLLRAALGTGADVQVVPHQSEQAPHQGVGALLRYADDDLPGPATS